MNKCFLLGHLGRDAEMRFTAQGTPVASFTLATTQKFTDRDGRKRENTQWHRVTVWGKQAEAIHQYLTKGKQVLVEGRVEYQEWEKDGAKHKSTNIVADRVTLLGGGGNGHARTGGGDQRRRGTDEDGDQRRSEQQGFEGPDNDEPPF